MSDQAEATAKRAYELYLERGSAPGYELEDWLKAEAELAAAAAGDAEEGKRAGSAESGRPEAATSRRSGRRENAPAPRESAPSSSTGRRALRP